jgi:hypothetical protein
VPQQITFALPRASFLRGAGPSDWLGDGRLRVREIDDDDDEGRRLVRIVRRGSGSVVPWRRAQIAFLSAQGINAAAIAKVPVHRRGLGAGCDPQLQR